MAATKTKISQVEAESEIEVEKKGETVAAPAELGVPVSAQVVGNIFVQQYYHALHQSPGLVHQFYYDISKLGRPEEDGTMSLTTTIDEINAKILSLNYEDFKTEIKTVDAQESSAGGVNVLVTGRHLTGKDEFVSNFTQSFFLAPQEKGYFVLNDMFRYMDKPKDRLSDLPEALQLRILACLDVKDAVQTTLLSKTWVNLWTRIPVLNFNNSSFNTINGFDKFVDLVLSRRDPSAKLEGLKFNGDRFCPDTLKKAFDYAFLHGVKQLEASMDIFYINNFCNYSWPVSVCDSLTSLKLETTGYMCPFLGPGFISLKNLTVLNLDRAIIMDVEPFSGFPVLESLTLLNCDFRIKNESVIKVEVSSHGLSNLTISYCENVKCWKLRTPKLRYLEYGGSDFPKHEGLPVLETLKIGFHGFSINYLKSKGKEKRWNYDLMSLFSTIPTVKSLKLFSTTVLLLSLFPDELVRRGSPFQELKDFTLDFSDYCCPWFFHKPGPFEYVKDYLLQNSPNAKFTINAMKGIVLLDADPWSYFLH